MAVRVSSPVLVGRSNELGRLRAAFEAAREGRSTATLVAGEAGVGKTRLVTEFAEAARSEGATILIGGCIDVGEGALPYGPIVEALRGLVRRSDPDEVESLLGQSRSELARLVPDLGPVAEDAASGLSVGSSQGRLFELLLGVLGRLAARAPVVFVVEDIHWSDRSTRDFLLFLVRNLREDPVTLVLTYRSDELHRRHPLLPFLAELERTGLTERLELKPFDRIESARQLRAIAGRELDGAFIDAIHVRSGGNPFFAEELLAAAGEDGSAELPRTLRDVLLARVAQLADPTQEFLRVASAAGQRVDPALLAAAASLDQSALYEALREAVASQVLVPDPTTGIERYAFRHALVEEAIYDDLLPGERTRLHAAFAETLEAMPGADAEHAAELAYHWNAAHDLPCALQWAVAAGKAAEGRYAFPEALVQYETAIDLWDHVPDAERRAGRDRVDLLAALAGVARFQEPGRAVSHIQAAIRLVEAAGDPVRAGLLNERLGRYAWIPGQGELANEAYGTAMRLIPSDPPSAARARAVAGLAQIRMLGGRFDEAGALAEEALTIARAVGARDIEGHAVNTRGINRGTNGDVEGALVDLRTALAIAEEEGIVDDIGRAHANIAWTLDLADRLDEAIRAAEVGIATSERLGLMRFFGIHLLAGEADYLYRLGRWDEAERAVQRVEEVGPFGINEILAHELRARLAMARGRFDEAARLIRPLASLAERAVDIQFIAPVHASLAELALWEAKPDEAVAHVDRAIPLIAHSHEVRIAEVYALGIRANADMAEIAHARRSADQEASAVSAGELFLEALRLRHVDVVADRPVFAPLSTGWMQLSEAEGTRLRRQPDPDAWVAAAEAMGTLRRPHVAAYARWREAEARLAARGDRAQAATALGGALATAERLHAEPLAREIRALAARARLTIERDEPEVATETIGEADRLGLTAREREVLGLVALGRTNRQIGEELFITENTAGVHVSNIIGKLGVSGRGEAAAVAYRLGLVEPAREPA